VRRTSYQRAANQQARMLRPVMLQVLPFPLLPPAFVAGLSRVLGKPLSHAGLVTVACLVLTVVAVVYAFLMWFGVNQCGE